MKKGSTSDGFPCRHCGGPTSCKDSRMNNGASPFRRRRWQCEDCGGRFSTFESILNEPNKKNVDIDKLQSALAVLAEHVRALQK